MFKDRSGHNTKASTVHKDVWCLEPGHTNALATIHVRDMKVWERRTWEASPLRKGSQVGLCGRPTLVSRSPMRPMGKSPTRCGLGATLHM